jgi:hypothetical protein
MDGRHSPGAHGGYHHRSHNMRGSFPQNGVPRPPVSDGRRSFVLCCWVTGRVVAPVWTRTTRPHLQSIRAWRPILTYSLTHTLFDIMCSFHKCKRAAIVWRRRRRRWLRRLWRERVRCAAAPARRRAAAGVRERIPANNARAHGNLGGARCGGALGGGGSGTGALPVAPACRGAGGAGEVHA